MIRLVLWSLLALGALASAQAAREQSIALEREVELAKASLAHQRTITEEETQTSQLERMALSQTLLHTQVMGQALADPRPHLRVDLETERISLIRGRQVQQTAPVRATSMSRAALTLLDMAPPPGDSHAPPLDSALPLSDGGYLYGQESPKAAPLPGTLALGQADLEALRPALHTGMPVYVY